MKEVLIIFGAKYLIGIAIGIAVFAFLRLHKKEKKDMLILASVALPLTYILALLSGYLYYNPRPFVVNNFVPLIPHSSDNGFPSDHVLLLSAIASLFYPFSKKISLVLWVCTVLVAVSRMYAGVHHGVDVIGSALISILVLWLSLYVTNHIFKSRDRKPKT